jgi:RNA polymerase sigma-70 factor (ECF subfamily)
VLARVNSRVRDEYESAGQGARFDALKIYLLAASDAELIPYERSAALLGLTLPAVKSAIFKLRRRYADTMRAEIAQTVNSPEEVEDEIRYLLKALAR